MNTTGKFKFSKPRCYKRKRKKNENVITESRIVVIQDGSIIKCRCRSGSLFFIFNKRSKQRR